MPEDMSDETLSRYLEDLLRTDKYRLRISEVGTAYPDERSIDMEFDDIDNYNRDLAEYLLNHPIKSLRTAEEAVRHILPPDIQYPLHVRIHGLPTTSNIQIRDLRGVHLGTLLAVDGLVRKVTEVRPRLIEAHFMCARCGFDNVVPQTDIFVREPFECEGCQKSANQTSFQFLQDFSVYVDTQKIEIQENPEGLRGGEQPQRLTAYTEDDITGRISPGDRVTLNGVLMSRQKHKGRMKSTVFDIHLDVNSIETRQSDYEELEITEEDILEIQELSQNPEIFEKLKQSIAPSIYGMEVEKEALSLQLFGGVRKFMTDGTKIRGDIHVLFVGDPGTAKSQLLRYISQISPRGIYTSGQATTKAGLTATAVKEEFGDGRWTLEAGALVLADKGIACLLPDTEVHVNDSWVPIKSLFDEEMAEPGMSNGEQVEICPTELRVMAFQKEGQLGNVETLGTRIRRKQYAGKVIDFTFESGFKVSMTPDHKLMDGSTLEWREARDFNKREFVAAPFKFTPPLTENNTLTLLKVLRDSKELRDERYLIELDVRERTRIVKALLRKKGVSKNKKRELLLHLIPDWDGRLSNIDPYTITEKIGDEEIAIPPGVLYELIELITLRKQFSSKSITFIGTVGSERYELTSLPPSFFYLFGRVYADDRRVVRETRPIRLLFQKFIRSYPDEYKEICSTSVGHHLHSSSRLLEGLYYYTIRENLAHLFTLPDSCVRAFLAGIIDNSVNVSVDTREKKGKEYSTVILRIVLPTIEKENLHLLATLRRYNIYGRLIRRKHMHTIQISNDSDVNNLRDLLRNYSININALPISTPHYYDISTTYTTSNIIPERLIRDIAKELLEAKDWSRNIRNQLLEFANETKQPVREHFGAFMQQLQSEELSEYRNKLENLLSRRYLLDRIVLIKEREYTGPVYDLYVPSLHNFVASGIFVHNCIDELDKMSKEDSSGMHEALEQQQISIAKAGITATLQSRCSLLAAANPKFGRFDDSENILGQLNMLPSLISRFDIIFPVLDKPDPREDGRIADHILKVHIEGERIMHNEALEIDAEEWEHPPDDSIRAEIPVDKIRKYVAHAKSISSPVMNDDAADYLSDYYVKFRSANKDSRAVPITARQLEALVRLAEASAKIRLSMEVTKKDAERAVRVMQFSLERIAMDAQGIIDIDRIGGVPQKKRSRLVMIRKIIENLIRQSEDGTFSLNDLIEEAKLLKIDSEEIRTYVKKRMDEGELMEPYHGRYRIV